MRVGLVGYGRWGANVLRDLIALGAEVAIAEPYADRRHRARRAGAAVGVSAAEELPDCDGYAVVTPARSHREVCEHLLRRGVPVFVEKPPCATLADVAALTMLAPDRLFVMHKWRYHPGIRALADLTVSGRLGTPQRLETIRTGPERLPPDVDVLWHLGTHDLSIAVEILGSVAPAQNVRATRDSGGRVTQCRATMAHPDGPDHRMTVASGVPNRVRRVVVSGNEATAVLDRADAPTIVVQTRHRTDEVAISPTVPLAEELRVFLAHLAGGPPPDTDAATAFAIAQRLSELQHMAKGTAA